MLMFPEVQMEDRVHSFCSVDDDLVCAVDCRFQDFLGCLLRKRSVVADKRVEI